MTGDENGESKIDAFCREETLAIQNGFACGDWNDEGTGILQIRPFNITNSGQIDLSTAKYVETDRNVEAYLLRSQDVIFNNTNSEELVGKTALWSRSERAVLSNHMTILRVLRQDRLCPEFLSFYLLKRWFDGYFHSVCRRHVNQASVSIERLRDTDFPEFDVPEQRKIAAVLGLVQRAIEQQDRLIALTTELKKVLLHKLFTEGLRGEPQKQTEIGPVPESWEVVCLHDICTFLSGGTPSKQKQEFWTGSIPWVSPKDMKKPRLSEVVDYISDAALQDGSSLAPVGAVFVVIRGMVLAKDIPVALAEVPMAFNQDMKAIIPGPRIVPSFLLYALVAFKQNLFQKVGRSAHGTMTLMSSELEQFSIPLPDRQTQEEIASAIETVEHKHEVHRRKHVVLTDFFRTLLHQLMTAEIRVHNLEIPELQPVIDEPAVAPRWL